MINVDWYPHMAVPLFQAIRSENPIEQYSRRYGLIRTHMYEIRKVLTYPIKTSFQLHVLEKNMAFKDIRFIDIKIARSDQPKVVAFAANFGNDVDELLVECMAQGYKWSLTYVDSQNSYVASLIGTTRSKHNKSCSLSSWSDDWREAIFLCGYKHIEIASEGDWEPHESIDRWG